MEIQKVMPEVIKPWAIHTLHVTVLVTPCKTLFTNHSVYSIKFRNIGVVHILTVL